VTARQQPRALHVGSVIDDQRQVESARLHIFWGRLELAVEACHAAAGRIMGPGFRARVAKGIPATALAATGLSGPTHSDGRRDCGVQNWQMNDGQDRAPARPTRVGKKNRQGDPYARGVPNRSNIRRQCVSSPGLMRCDRGACRPWLQVRRPHQPGDQGGIERGWYAPNRGLWTGPAHFTRAK
jgi:hypothetical protein